MKVMTERTLKRPEVLAPAGTLEKLKVAIRYGADAVYIGGNAVCVPRRKFHARRNGGRRSLPANIMRKFMSLPIWSLMKETRKGQERFQRIARHRNFSCDCFRSSFNRNCARSTRFTYPFIDTSFSNQL